MSRLLLVTVTTVLSCVLLLIRQQPSVDAPAIVLLHHHMLFATSSDVANCSAQRDALLARMTNGTLGGNRAARSAHESLAKAVMVQRGSIELSHV